MMSRHVLKIKNRKIRGRKNVTDDLNFGQGAKTIT